ncbi:hypothetical protein [Solibacillus sp. FSL H8-0538]|uniref:hypothetical protein n=1 Tax=Solibacillus sp. FSL H8-0538 TaxID=2921400 RepID=UPI0030F5E29F
MPDTHRQGASNKKGSLAKKTKNDKEEISLELAELGNLLPKQEPMTPNQREKSEREKFY